MGDRNIVRDNKETQDARIHSSWLHLPAFAHQHIDGRTKSFAKYSRRRLIIQSLTSTLADSRKGSASLGYQSFHITNRHMWVVD